MQGLRSLDPFLNHLPEVSGDSEYQELPFCLLWLGPGSLGGGHRDSPSQDLPGLPLTPESLLLLALEVPMIQTVRTKRSPEATGAAPSPRMEKPRTHAEQGTGQGEEWGVPLGRASARCCEGSGRGSPWKLRRWVLLCPLHGGLLSPCSTQQVFSTCLSNTSVGRESQERGTWVPSVQNFMQIRATTRICELTAPSSPSFSE